MEEAKGTARFMKSSSFRWAGVENDGYGGSPAPSPTAAYSGVERFVLFGNRDEIKFHLRYFEVGPGGYSRLEKHHHPHCVVVIRGRGKLIMDKSLYDMSCLDAVYIAPFVPHQLVNDSDEPFGFFCAVDAERDEPVPLEGEELSLLMTNPVVGPYVRTGGAFSCELRKDSGA